MGTIQQIHYHLFTVSTMFTIVVLVTLVSTTAAFRCQYEQTFETPTTEANFTITPQEDRSRKVLWVSDTNLFLFGKIEKPHKAKIQATLHNEDTGAPMYRVIVNCKDKTWKTMYDKNQNGKKLIKWKEGKLENGCTKTSDVESSDSFDLIAKIGCPNRDKFDDIKMACPRLIYYVFNGQVLEGYRQYTMDKSNHQEKYVQSVPMFLNKGKIFRAEVVKDSGAYFTKISYGKCFDFPPEFHQDCSVAKTWLYGRSTNSPLGNVGLWEFSHTADCDKENPKLFDVVQRRIIPDGSAMNAAYNFQASIVCCCSYIDGFVDNASCTSSMESDPKFTCSFFTPAEPGACDDHNVALGKDPNF